MSADCEDLGCSEPEALPFGGGSLDERLLGDLIPGL